MVHNIAEPMLDLHERLSEFSYGYGVTSEFEAYLKAKGVSAVPFLPSLLQEKKVGFDVAWKKPGAPLMVQFKLGQQLERFRRRKSGGTVPLLERPFWRFHVNTTEVGGQFLTLLDAEKKGAEVYYAAPKFAVWSDYVTAFQDKKILKASILIKPREIQRGAKKIKLASGIHFVAYDNTRRYVCSDPIRIESTPIEEVISRIVDKKNNGEALGTTLRRVFESDEHSDVPELSARGIETRRAIRMQFLERVRAQARSEDDAIAVTLAAEAWAKGILTVFAGNAA